MKRFIRNLRYAWVEILVFLTACLLFLGSCVVQHQVWAECRETHSFWFCVYLVGKS